MNEFVVEVRISPRAGLLDPQGKAIHSALHSLEFDEVEDVRVGRLVRMKLLADSPQGAREAAEQMCRRLLANPVTEDFDIEVDARAA